MNIARTILAFVTALSLAVLPTAGPAPAAAKSTEQAAVTAGSPASTEISEAMDDCCPDHAKPCDQGGDQCRSMASCAHPSFGVSSVDFSPIVHLLLSGNRLFAVADPIVPSHAGYPPFRPPRV